MTKNEEILNDKISKYIDHNFQDEDFFMAFAEDVFENKILVSNELNIIKYHCKDFHVFLYDNNIKFLALNVTYNFTEKAMKSNSFIFFRLMKKGNNIRIQQIRKTYSFKKFKLYLRKEKIKTIL